jgi:uncharacterized surface protein with fasciclin (FAS1) repeats
MDTGNYIGACSDKNGYWLNKNTDLVWGSQYTRPCTAVLGVTARKCHSIDKPDITDAWCQLNCNFGRPGLEPNCPPTLCKCDGPDPGKMCPMSTEVIACMPRDCTASDVALVSAMETKALCARMKPYDLSSCAVKYAVEVDDDDGGDDQKTIMDMANNHKDLSTLVLALKAGGLVETLSGPGPFTVFAPTNEAFAALPAATLKSLFHPANKAALVKVLKYHVAAGHVDHLNNNTVIKTLEGANVIVRWEPYPVGIVVQGGTVANLAKVDKPDVEASNGVAHWIKALLFPPAAIDALIAGSVAA